MTQDDPTAWTLDDLERHLHRALLLTPSRCVFGALVTPPALHDALTERLHALAATHALPEGTLQIVPVDGAAASLDLAGSWNARRPTLLNTLRLFVFTVPDTPTLRLLSARTADLLTNPDFLAWLQLPRVERPWPEVADDLRALMRERHTWIDLFALLPYDTDHHTVRLEDLYLPLVDLRPLPTLKRLPASDWSPSSDQPLPQLTFELPTAPTSRAWLVTGNPGAGKTTTLRHIALTAAQGRPHPDLPPHDLAILLPLAEYADALARDHIQPLLTFLVAWLEAQGIPGAHALSAHLDTTILLLDGLDEVRDPNTRRRILHDVHALLDRGLAAAVLSARPFVLDELRPNDTQGLHIAPARPLTDAQIERFLHTFGLARRRTAAELDALTTAVLHRPNLHALAATPLILAFLSILDELEGRLPEHRVEIYYRLGELLTDRWRRARTLAATSSSTGPPPPRPTRGDVLRVLGPLAVWMLERGGAPVPHDDLLHTIATIEAEREGSHEAAAQSAARLLDVLKADTALLQRSPDGRWSFLHLSLIEYFAAVETERDPRRWADLLTDPFNPGRREVLLLTAGILAILEGRVYRLDELCDALLKKSRRAGVYPAHYPLLLMALVREVPTLTARHLDALLDRSFEFVLTNHFGQNAVNELQGEFMALLEAAPGTALHAPVKAVAQRWFAPPDKRIDWWRITDYMWEHFWYRVFKRTWLWHEEEALLSPERIIEILEEEIDLGVLVNDLPRALERLDVPRDPELLAHIAAQKTDWLDSMKQNVERWQGRFLGSRQLSLFLNPNDTTS